MRVLTDSILDMMGGRTIIEAETILDTARQLIWVHVFSGRLFEAVARELDASQEAVDVAVMVLSDVTAQVRRQQGLPEGSPSAWPMLMGFAFLDRLFQEVRLTLYIAAYQDDASSRFGQHAAEWHAAYAEKIKPIPFPRPSSQAN